MFNTFKRKEFNDFAYNRYLEFVNAHKRKDKVDLINILSIPLYDVIYLLISSKLKHLYEINENFLFKSTRKFMKLLWSKLEFIHYINTLIYLIRHGIKWRSNTSLTALLLKNKLLNIMYLKEGNLIILKKIGEYVI